jgi:hypothetical protein
MYTQVNKWIIKKEEVPELRETYREIKSFTLYHLGPKIFFLFKMWGLESFTILYAKVLIHSLVQIKFNDCYPNKLSDCGICSVKKKKKICLFPGFGHGKLAA